MFDIKLIFCSIVQHNCDWLFSIMDSVINAACASITVEASYRLFCQYLQFAQNASRKS